MFESSSKVSDKNKQGMLSWPKFIRKRILMSEFRKSNSGFGISSFKISCVSMLKQTYNFNFFGSNLFKNEFYDRNFENLIPDSESAPPRYDICQFSGKTDNFKFFGLNLGKQPNYVRYFGSYNVEGFAESYVQAEMSWVELSEAGWRWMELGGGGCTVQQYPLKKEIFQVFSCEFSEILKEHLFYGKPLVAASSENLSQPCFSGKLKDNILKRRNKDTVNSKWISINICGSRKLNFFDSSNENIISGVAQFRNMQQKTQVLENLHEF